ncbi:MAG: hypothetical protein ACI4XQ_04150 [Eubacteriales bacterium]
MKTKTAVSAVFGFFFGLITYFILWCIEEKDAFLFALVSGLFCCLALFTFLMVREKVMDKKYAKAEKKILSHVFYKTKGNFVLHSGKIKNANIYFCEDGIVIISLDEKPCVMEKIQKGDIREIQFEDIHFIINTGEGQFYIATIPDAKAVFDMLREKQWFFPV